MGSGDLRRVYPEDLRRGQDRGTGGLAFVLRDDSPRLGCCVGLPPRQAARLVSDLNLQYIRYSRCGPARSGAVFASLWDLSILKRQKRVFVRGNNGRGRAGARGGGVGVMLSAAPQKAERFAFINGNLPLRRGGRGVSQLCLWLERENNLARPAPGGRRGFLPDLPLFFFSSRRGFGREWLGGENERCGKA